MYDIVRREGKLNGNQGDTYTQVFYNKKTGNNKYQNRKKIINTKTFLFKTEVWNFSNTTKYLVLLAPVGHVLT